MNDTEHQDVPTESRLSQILAPTAEQMLSEFKKIRISFDHNGMAGEGGETVVAEFLRSQLPQSIGICTGEILDVTGQTSKQEDVILYDAEHTPMLFADQNKKLARVPAEGVLGVVEVKTHLRSSDIETYTRVNSMKSKKTFRLINVLTQYVVWIEVSMSI